VDRLLSEHIKSKDCRNIKRLGSWHT